jgi:hypothetical protein
VIEPGGELVAPGIGWRTRHRVFSPRLGDYRNSLVRLLFLLAIFSRAIWLAFALPRRRRSGKALAATIFSTQRTIHEVNLSNSILEASLSKSHRFV